MSTITIEGIYDNGIIRSINKINGKPRKIYIILDYEDFEHKQININNLIGIIDEDFSKDYYNKYLLNKYI